MIVSDFNFCLELGFIFKCQNVEICLIEYYLDRLKFHCILNLKQSLLQLQKQWIASWIQSGQRPRKERKLYLQQGSLWLTTATGTLSFLVKDNVNSNLKMVSMVLKLLPCFHHLVLLQHSSSMTFTCNLDIFSTSGTVFIWS